MMDFPTIFSITEDKLDLDDLLAKITLTSTGAAAIFAGMVRGVTSRGEAHETEFLEYEAYIPMAEAKMKQVAEEIRTKWPVVEGIAIVQRIGKLYPRTPTVLIACTAAHRDTGVFDSGALRDRPFEGNCPDLEEGSQPGRRILGGGGLHPESRRVGTKPSV